MPRLLWLTDIHLSFVEPRELESFYAAVQAAQPDVVAITGDIGEGSDVPDFLRTMERRWDCPIVFVLGNHDYYRTSIATVRQTMGELTREHPTLVYLSQRFEPYQPVPGITLVGHDGWADARIGDWEQSTVMLNDYLLIEELAHLRKHLRRRRLEELGDEAAAHLRRVLPLALDRSEALFVLTHVPPYREACWYDGRISDDEWAPHFSCQATGEAIREVLLARPDRSATVLCGHTHGRGEATILPNLEVLTGEARYGFPVIQRIFDIPYEIEVGGAE